MKILVATLVIVLILAVSALITLQQGNAKSALDSSTELEIHEVVLRYEIEALERAHPGDLNICFVAIQRNDPMRCTKEGIPFPPTYTLSEPDATFLSHFADAPRRVMPRSECTIMGNEYVHKISRKPGFVLCLGDVRRKSNAEVEATCSSVSVHSSTSRRYQVIRTNGRWQVVQLLDVFMACG